MTGGANGIGLAVAERLVKEGARVCIVDLNRQALDAAGERFGSAVLTIQADVSDEAAVVGYVRETRDRFGRIDMFFNNAGYFLPPASLLDSTLEEFERSFSVNVRGCYLGLREVAKSMRETGGGTIVNTSSVSAMRGRANQAIYGATKAAVSRMTQNAAIELGPLGIRVNGICPGIVLTDMIVEGLAKEAGSKEAGLALLERRMAEKPLRRGAQPDEIANLVVWLLGPESSYVAGSLYTVDGGSSA